MQIGADNYSDWNLSFDSVVLDRKFLDTSTVVYMGGKESDPGSRSRITIPDILVEIGGKRTAGGDSCLPPMSIREEAALMSLWLSDDLESPEWLSLQIEARLRDLRAIYGPYMLALNRIHFSLPYVPSRIVLGMTDSAMAEVRRGSYHAWNSLNAEYDLVSIDTSMFYLQTVRLIFSGTKNPCVLLDHYSILPDLRYAHIEVVSGDRPNIYPWISEGEFTFLLRDAWGDCPMGCDYGHYWYFEMRGSEPRLVGDFESGEHTVYPDWWVRAAEAVRNYSDYCPGSPL
jgi:hypothetical protein